MQRWEYEIVELFALTKDEVQAAKKTLNQLGQKGWEVCGALNLDEACANILLKRPLQ
jgi:hypothetical protein